MFTVRTSLRPSPIQGLGCFADEVIKKGQVVWEFDPRLDIRITLSDIKTFPPFMQDHFRTYCYVELLEGQEILVYCADFSKHMNHSDTPNLIETENNLCDIAICDIAVGEELTCDYYRFDLRAAEKLSIDKGHTA